MKISAKLSTSQVWKKTDGLSSLNRISYTPSLNTWARIFMNFCHPFYYTFSL